MQHNSTTKTGFSSFFFFHSSFMHLFVAMQAKCLERREERNDGEDNDCGYDYDYDNDDDENMSMNKAFCFFFHFQMAFFFTFLLATRSWSAIEYDKSQFDSI